jgi:hypothetical protein
MNAADEEVTEKPAPPQTSTAPDFASENAAQPAEKDLAGEGDRSMAKDDADFIRMRYLFWRYLDWQQRLKVLVDVNALPETADQPLPQILEGQALDSAARDRATLRRLWEAIMPLIPVEKRGKNPF